MTRTTPTGRRAIRMAPDQAMTFLRAKFPASAER
jgi:hypothetical protein